MNEDIIKASECRHPYFDEGRCIDCGASYSRLIHGDGRKVWERQAEIEQAYEEQTERGNQ